jgi:hypothetical protein
MWERIEVVGRRRIADHLCIDVVLEPVVDLVRPSRQCAPIISAKFLAPRQENADG